MNLRLWGVLLAGALGLAGCDKVPLLAPSESTISLATNSAIVQANGTAHISATVLESSGTPVQNGTSVTFSTNFGTLSATEARTTNGVATVDFLAGGQSGIAEVRAASGAAQPDDTVPLKLTVGGAAASRIQLSANPGSVPVSGGSTTISALVVGASGDPLSGVPVSFSTDAGALSASFATTGSNGTAQVTLTASKDATVTATAGGTDSTAPVTATLHVLATTLPTLAVDVTTATPTEDLPTIFRITAGSAAQDSFQSVTIDFGDGSSRPLGALAPGTSTSASNVYTSDGTYTVTVAGLGLTGGTQRATTIVTVAPHAPVNVDITTTPASGPFATTNAIGFTVVTPTGATVDHVDWAFGDGTAVQRTSGKSTSHHYNAAGTYTVTATVTTVDGNTGTGRIEIVVN